MLVGVVQIEDGVGFRASYRGLRAGEADDTVDHDEVKLPVCGFLETRIGPVVVQEVMDVIHSGLVQHQLDAGMPYSIVLNTKDSSEMAGVPICRISGAELQHVGFRGQKPREQTTNIVR